MSDSIWRPQTAEQGATFNHQWLEQLACFGIDYPCVFLADHGNITN